MIRAALELATAHWRIATALAVAAALTGGVYWIRNDAWHDGYAAHEAEVADKTADLNARLDRLTEKHRAATEAYLRKRAEAQELKEQLDEQARTSDNADRPALDAGSVRRLPRQP